MTERLSALVLDGDAASLSTISEMLAKWNFRVFPFQTVEAALDFIKRGAAKEEDLDLVLVEVNLNNMPPGTSATSDLFHHVLNELQVPLMAMCSRDDEEALSQCMNLGARFHVLKPLDRKSFSILWHQALEHKSKKAAPQGPTLNSTQNRMVSSSSQKPLILERNDLSNPERNGYEEPEKRNRVTWTIELHVKFLEAVEALGGNERATPERILHLMNVKGLTVKHIGSHLQKHRLRHRNAKQGGQRQENASRRPIPGLMISAHDEATFESITPRVETYREVYPLRMWTEIKKKSVDTAALKTDMYTCTSENYREDTGSVWDKYENKQRVFSDKKKHWQFMSLDQCPWKNNIIITNEAPETAGGASIEISGSSSLLTSDQVRQNGDAKATRDNDNLGSISLPQGYDAFTGISGSSNMLMSNQVGDNNRTEFARDNNHISLLEVNGASIENAGSSSLLTSHQVGQNNLTEAARNNDTMGNISFLEGMVDPDYIASMDFSVTGAHQENNDLDLTGPSDAWEEADSFRRSLLEGSQEYQSLGPEGFLQVGYNTYSDALELDALELVGLEDDPMIPIAQDNVLWTFSPARLN